MTNIQLLERMLKEADEYHCRGGTAADFIRLWVAKLTVDATGNTKVVWRKGQGYVRKD